jgi:Cu(I)/Ag(I) efflux system membrane protein CusA/SilA
MIATIIELSVKNKFLVILATLFVIAAGIYAIARTPLDAIPDLSDVQVIIFTEYPGQAPQVVEDQVTYPLTTAMLSVPFAKVVRGYLLFRHFLRLHHLRGRHRPLLGPQPCAGIP